MTSAFGRDDRADVAPLDDDVPLGRELALPVPHHLAHLGVAGDGRDHAVDPDLPDRAGDVGPVDRHAPAGVEGDRVLACEPAEHRPVAEIDAAPEREPRQAPVHRARVEVAEAEPVREAARHGALARSRRAVDRHDHGVRSSRAEG